MNKDNQLNSIAKLLTTAAAALVVVIGLQYIASDLIAPILLAIFLSILLMPLFRFFRKRGFSSGVSLVLMLVTTIVIAGGLIFFMTWSFSLLRDSLAVYTDNFRESFTRTSQQIGVSEQTTEVVTNSISPTSITRLFSAIVSSFGSLVLYLVVVPILAILILIQTDKVPKGVSDQLKKENPGLSKYSKFADSIMIYVTGRFKVNLVTGLLFALALLLIGVDFPFVWGTLTVFLSFIPYIGLVLAAAPPTLIAFAQDGIVSALVVIIAVVLINIFAENVLDPIVQGRGNKISAAAVVMSIIFWGWLLGPVGLILAAPLTVLLKMVFAEYKETVWIASIIEGDYTEASKKSKASSSKIKNIGKKFSSMLPRK